MITAVKLDDARVRKISPAMPIKMRKNSANLLQQQQQQQQQQSELRRQVTADQCIQAHGPLQVFTALHDKLCLVVGQGKVLDIADDLGFKNVCTIEQITEAYPLLDMVDHDNRRKIATQGYVEKDFPKVEAVVLLGEPKRWESALQILVDVLRSDGRPNQVPASSSSCRQLPVVACNMDLQFQHSAAMPRYGHGAFLLCLEALFKKVTGRELRYTALVGKPSEITFRYAEHVLTSQTRKLGFSQPIKTMYLIGDTPEVDIVGTNLYQRHVDRMSANRDEIDNNNSGGDPAGLDAGKDVDSGDVELPACRVVPPPAAFHRQTVDTVVPILVRTGVYRGPAAADCGDRSPSLSSSEEEEEVEEEEEADSGVGDERDFQGHRDFPNNAELRKPECVCDDVAAAIDYILGREEWQRV